MGKLWRASRAYLSKYAYLIAGLAVLLLFSWLLYHNSFNSPWERDEGEYAYSAWLLDSGQMPYQDSFLQKPPLIVYTYYLAHLISPFAVWPPRLLAFLFALLASWLLALAARKLYGTFAYWAAIIISPLLLSSPYLTGLAANTEKFMLLPLVGLLALFVFCRDREEKRIYVFAGVLAALAILYKPIAFLPAATLIIYWLISSWRRGLAIKSAVRNLGLVILGALATALTVLLPVVISGAFPDFWRQAVIFNFSYAADLKKYFPGMFWHYAGIFWNNWWPILLLLPAAIFWRPKLFGLWCLLLVAALLTVATSPMGHYYLLLMPFIVLLAAGSLSKILEISCRHYEEWRPAVFLMFIVLMLAVAFCSVGEQFSLSPREISTWIYGTNNPFREAEIIAPEIISRTAPADKIFVAGSEPQIYYFSRRLSASRFDITYPLIIDTPFREGYQRLAIADLEENKPAAVVYSRSSESGLWNEESPRLFIDYLDKLLGDYHLVGGTVWMAGEPVFMPASDHEQEMAKASLWFFVK